MTTYIKNVENVPHQWIIGETWNSYENDWSYSKGGDLSGYRLIDENGALWGWVVPIEPDSLKPGGPIYHAYTYHGKACDAGFRSIVAAGQFIESSYVTYVLKRRVEKLENRLKELGQADWIETKNRGY